jgi:hypothetical protein
MVKILSFDVGIINLAYCIFDSELNKIQDWGIIDLKVEGFSGKVPSGLNKNMAKAANDIHVTLIKKLDSFPILLNVDYVVIEKQPSFNPKMRIIAGCLQTYFYIRGVVDKKDTPIKSVEFFSPKHKLKCYTGPEIDISSKNGKTVKGKYAQTKKMGVEIARRKLEEYNETREFTELFESSKKRDDLSDCYLQALTYLTFKQTKKAPSKTVTAPSKTVLKQQFKAFLDNSIKNCTVMELMENNFKSIHELEFPFSLPESVETMCAKFSMKKYIKLKYKA